MVGYLYLYLTFEYYLLLCVPTCLSANYEHLELDWTIMCSIAVILNFVLLLRLCACVYSPALLTCCYWLMVANFVGRHLYTDMYLQYKLGTCSLVHVLVLRVCVLDTSTFTGTIRASQENWLTETVKTNEPGCDSSRLHSSSNAG